ncbi:MAG TPA: hypothetical protein VGP41_09335 [Candidatus Lustribacter sp.]|jgi:hypothetical protein|nr:hypothetical protein [Candidatus Lustribacter sp.]
MYDQPFFDRWRAKLIANLDPGSVGELDSIRFAQVAPTVAAVCPFLRYDGEPCEQLITYYLQVGSGIEDDLSYALGACHRHLGHAFDVLFTADRVGLPDPCDDDAVDASTAALPARPPVLDDDLTLAERLLATGIAVAADFGTTALDEGYPTVSGARITLAAHVAARLREGAVLSLAADLGVDVFDEDDGTVTFTTPQPDSAEEWISQNCALRELINDVLENSIDPIGYRYRTIADALPEVVDFEPRIYTGTRSGPLEVRTRIASTPAERTWERDIDPDRRQTMALFVDELPRPGDYLDVNFALYRFVRVWPDNGAHGAETVLERVKQPSRN